MGFPTGRVIISVIVTLFFCVFITFLFAGSLAEDKYLHLLKDNYRQDVSGIDLEFVGFKADIISSEREIIFEDSYPVVYYQKDYQNWVCHTNSKGDRSCNWETYKTESDSTPFVVSAGGTEVKVAAADKIQFRPMNSVTEGAGDSQTRIVKYTIKNSDPVYLWGYLEGSELKPYDYYFNGPIFLVTDNGKDFFVGNITGILLMQIMSTILFIILCVILYFVWTVNLV